MQGAWVWSLVWELRSHVPRGTARKKKIWCVISSTIFPSVVRWWTGTWRWSLGFPSVAQSQGWQERAPASERDVSRGAISRPAGQEPSLRMLSEWTLTPQHNKHHRCGRGRGRLKTTEMYFSQFWSFEIPVLAGLGSPFPNYGGGWCSLACSCTTAAPASVTRLPSPVTSGCLPSVCLCPNSPFW